MKKILTFGAGVLGSLYAARLKQSGQDVTLLARNTRLKDIKEYGIVLEHGGDVLKLGLVSFLTDLSSEMIFSVFAIFFTTIAGASAALLGLVEGLADLSASSLNYYAGWLSDRTGKRKIFVLAGYGFSTLAKVILLVSSSITGLTIFRVIEPKSGSYPAIASCSERFHGGKGRVIFDTT